MNSESRNFSQALQFTGVFMAIIWLVHIVQVVLGIRFWKFGVIAGDIGGLKGIFTAPLIHGDWTHLIGNTIPLTILMMISFYFFHHLATIAFFAIYLGAGLCVWFTESGAVHIGASGLVYGLVAFVFWMGLFDRDVKSIALSLTILFLYSGLFEGILPGKDGMSWQTHLFGAIIGILVAFIGHKWGIHKDDDEDEGNDEIPPKRKFLEEDTFQEKIEKNQSWTQDIPQWNTTNKW